MTPILRKSKESARKQRAKPYSEKKSSSQGRPLSSKRTKPPSDSRYERKRRYGDQYVPPIRPKYNRYRERDRPYPTEPPYPRSSRVRSYDEYLRTYRHGSSSSGAYSSYQSSYSSYTPSRSYYDVTGRLPDHERSHEDRRMYDRSVDEFLRRTSESSRYRDRSFRR